MKRILLFLIPIAILAACSEDPLAPRPNDNQTTEDLWVHGSRGEGLLSKAYENLDEGLHINWDYYTDNAVPSTQGTNALALGQWTVENNPIGQWANNYTSIKYLNTFLENAQDLAYQVGAEVEDSITRSHRIGEAYYLRAWYQWKLLQTYGGIVDGEPMGFPIVTDVIDRDEALSRSRDTYEDCVAQIAADCDEAISRLPMMYDGSGNLYGLSNRGRGSGLAAMALKARMYLYAASPAYGEESQTKWERAAQAAYEAIEAAGGLTALQPYGNFNNGASFDHIWIQPTYSSNGLESSYYPPSLYGSGNANPSENLVDAFPAADGYPIEQSGAYDEDKPYENRDPRFDRFIFYNGDQYNGTFIRTHQGGPDAPGGLSRQGTRTGYYMKKHLSYNVRLTPGDQTSDIKFKVYLGKTELYLNFAEAANEAYGPTAATLGYSAADAMRMIRQRAGVDSDPATSGYQDQYLDDQASAGKAAFRDFIQNERRLELAFEGHRFWDMRRWNMPLDHTVKGVTITEGPTPDPDPSNIALQSEPSSDYVSPYATIDPINDGYEPTSSTDGSHGLYHNWWSAGQWRYVQYDFPSYMTSEGFSNTYLVDQSDVYWFSDGGGVLLPDSTYIEYWDQDAEAWVEVSNWSGYGMAGDQWNTTTFDEVATSSIRMHMKSNTQSTGIIEWRVWGVPENPVSYVQEEKDVETHTYQDYMRYVPIPYNETLIMENLRQNSGW